MKESDLELLHKIVKFEDSLDMGKEFKIGWAYRHVGIQGTILSRLFLRGYLDNVFRSNSYTGYRLSELGRAIVSSSRQEDEADPETPRQLDIAENSFGDIIGHDEIKELLRACLLAGPPALAKSLFLWYIERAGGERAI